MPPIIVWPPGIMRFVEEEAAGRGLGWGQIAEPGKGPSLLGVWGFLLLDACLYMFCALHAETKG